MKPMRILAFAIVAAASPLAAEQTTSEREAVLKTVQAFFDTMTARDVEGARKILVPQGRFHAMDMRKPKVDREDSQTRNTSRNCRR